MSRAPVKVTEAQRVAVDTLARLIVRWRLTVPAILTLESMQPLAFVGSQFMHVLSPVATGLVPFAQWDEVARLLEDRRGVEYVITTLEQHSAGRPQPAAPTPSEVTP